MTQMCCTNYEGTHETVSQIGTDHMITIVNSDDCKKSRHGQAPEKRSTESD